MIPDVFSQSYLLKFRIHPKTVFSLLSFYSIFSRESIFIRIPERYDFERGIIHVKKQLCPPRKNDGSGKYYWGTLKNGKTRIIHPAPFVMDFDKPVCNDIKEKPLVFALAQITVSSVIAHALLLDIYQVFC